MLSQGRLEAGERKHCKATTVGWICEQKAPPREPERGPTGLLLDLGYAFSLQAFGTLADLKFHKLAFGQRLVAIHLNGREVNEDIFPRLTLNEPIPL